MSQPLILDGNAIAAELLAELKAEVAALAPLVPRVEFVRVGEDPASVSYVAKKQKTAAALGIEAGLTVFPPDVPRAAFFAKLDALNADPAVHGILVQAPLPPHLPEVEVFNRVDPRKDIDGFSAANLGRLVQEDPAAFAACTPAGLVEILRRRQIPTAGRHVVVVGRSLIVGKPAALLFLRRGLGDATVTVCHSRTPDLAEHCRRADILVAALGKPRFITGAMLRPGAVVLDVGINRVPDSAAKGGTRLVGDVDFESARAVVSAITPVPGGVGPMTVALLMRNTVQAARQFRQG